MTELLQQTDAILFTFFNQTLANPLFDWIMPVITNKYTWFPVWILILILLLWKGGKRGRWALLVLILTIIVTEPLVNRLLKPLFDRVRPCNALPHVHLLVKKHLSPSLPSAHAANFFAVATVLSFFYRKYQSIFWSVATVVAYSRVAVGVHYPFDVLAGAVVGVACGWLWLWFLKKPLSGLQMKENSSP